MSTEKIWFVTGAAGGLGLALVRMLLDQGGYVAATADDVDVLMEAVGAKLEGRFLPLEVNLADEGNVRRAVDTAIAAFGRIDVVVNHAGRGLSGPLEALSDEALRGSFDINVFGVLNVVRAVMPRLRAQRAGHVFNISSILGFDGGRAGWGAYSAAKFAVSGLTEALALEAAPHGVRVSLVYPGAMRAGAEEIGGHPEAGQAAAAGHPAAGDPAKAARALIQAADAQYAPLHLFLGRDAFDQARGKIQSVQQELARWREMSVSIGFVDERRMAA
ncbi:SDR family NAD(P)-dependent oxidoreductase [Achromobacter dolens]|uniref:SDR family NAD(P)-dependent oxidoreductase n=1 Tax=Achromobacter dolens TaxID=1287738 RepID=UPI000AFF67E1|nr:SDR family NAD(P)-dependent oxidoreductase [Achromobacter dolens]CAB3831602.1 3-phenylpropionate-dihydrodiol/cinnamic acid-dihydrodiol dehydrogenase [Achromobacter dolens]